MPCYSLAPWPVQPVRQDNRPSGRSRIGRGFHPKKQR